MSGRPRRETWIHGPKLDSPPLRRRMVDLRRLAEAQTPMVCAVLGEPVVGARPAVRDRERDLEHDRVHVHVRDAVARRLGRVGDRAELREVEDGAEVDPEADRRAGRRTRSRRPSARRWTCPSRRRTARTSSRSGPGTRPCSSRGRRWAAAPRRAGRDDRRVRAVGQLRDGVRLAERAAAGELGEELDAAGRHGDRRAARPGPCAPGRWS